MSDVKHLVEAAKHRQLTTPELDQVLERYKDSRVTFGGLVEAIKSIGKSIGQKFKTVQTRIRTLEELVFSADLRLDNLEKSLKRIEDAGQMVYEGTWEAGKAYKPGATVTWSGSCWVARRKTTSKPGDGTPEVSGWSLAVRRGGQGEPGRDGRDGAPGGQR